MPDIQVHNHYHLEGPWLGELCQTITHSFDRLIAALKEGTEAMSQELDALTAQVAANRTVAQSAITLISGLAQQILDHVNDPAALTALANELKATDQELSDAVLQNTPATP